MKKHIKTRYLGYSIVLYSIMSIILFITVYPFINILAISLNDATDTLRGGIYLAPRKFTLLNYTTVFSFPALPVAALLSVLRTVAGTAAGIICTAMFAYALQQKHFILKKPVSILLLLTLYIGGGIIPDFFLMRSLGLINNFLVYILPGLINAWNVIIVRAYMESIPDSISEAAKMDGAHDFLIFFKIIFPLCAPVIATIGLFIAVGQWNSWFDTFLYCSGEKFLTTLQYELMRIMKNVQTASNADVFRGGMEQGSTMITPQAIQAAITIIATVPILFVYPFVQKHFVRGIQLGAIKE
ncbi:MAG: carbohydrate ABC transporter permease [Spirochaetales bacterium]|nr:carbohydrate ABC transporter permease [Spirochaetales bacterium]